MLNVFMLGKKKAFYPNMTDARVALVLASIPEGDFKVKFIIGRNEED